MVSAFGILLLFDLQAEIYGYATEELSSKEV